MLTHIRYGVLAIMACVSLYFYYFHFYPVHSEQRDFFLIYLLIFGVVFGVYKWIQLLLEVPTVTIRVKHVVYLLLFQLFIACLCFFAFNGTPFFSGIRLFIKIIPILVAISALWLVIYAFWRSLLWLLKIPFFDEHPLHKSLAGIWLWFGVYMMGVFILAYFWYYQIYPIAIWTVICAVLGFWSYTHIWQLKDVVVNEYSDISVKDTPKKISLLIDELHLYVLTFVLSINFLSIYRPFPIGWDDLGAYMNYPKLLSWAWELLPIGKMYLWELFTGIGFLVRSQTYAFYLSSFSWIIVTIVVYIGIRTLMKNKEGIFDIPLFAVMILMILPMSVFQLAKDMKLDYALLSISSIALFLMYGALYGGKHFSHKSSLTLLALIGFLIGIAFSIKVTSLMLLLWVLAMLFYKKLSLAWFAWFFSLFVSIFTFLGLWDMMNVIIPESSEGFRLITSAVFLFMGIAFLSFSFSKKKAWNISHLHIVSETLCILLGFFIALTPWVIKHVEEVPEGKKLTLGKLISWSTHSFFPDYREIYEEDEVNMRKKLSRSGLWEDGTTSNEDFGRYFWYEEGINNYLKLPWNLTFQVNQGGEFTDISYIFFVLIPALFFFLPFRRQEYMYPMGIFLMFLLLYYIPNPLWENITKVFSQVWLPWWYIAIMGFVFAPFIYFFYTVDRSSQNMKLLLATLSFSSMYIFLWAISAFGVVWYGIVMYVAFLIMIALILDYIQDHSELQDKNSISSIVLIIVGIYTITSVIPHGVTNISSAWYKEYKQWLQNEDAAIFSLHPDYITILLHLNIQERFHEKIFEGYKTKISEIVWGIPQWQSYIEFIDQTDKLQALNSLVRSLVKQEDLSSIHTWLISAQQKLYADLISPGESMRSNQYIYRVGTFLKYYITQNSERLFEDSLLFQYEHFIYDKDSAVAIQRLKDIDISYILLDLNAATIDNGGDKLLTERYTHLLKTTLDRWVELIETDSICLRLWLEHYRVNQDKNTFMKIAGVNFGTKEEKVEKRELCLREFTQAVQVWEIDFILPYRQQLVKWEVDLEDFMTIAQALVRYLHPWWKALFKIK